MLVPDAPPSVPVCQRCGAPLKAGVKYCHACYCDPTRADRSRNARKAEPVVVVPAPPPGPVEPLELDDVETGADEDVPDIEDDERPPALVGMDERRCRTRTCLKKFQPTHPAHHYCPACRGLRQAVSTTATSESWWTKTTSREDFQKRAAARVDEMHDSKEARLVPNKIL